MALGYSVRHKGYTKSDWELSNPVISAREIVIETDTNKIKVGDGVKKYSALPYISGAAQSYSFDNFLHGGDNVIVVRPSGGSDINLADFIGLVEQSASSDKCVVFVMPGEYSDPDGEYHNIRFRGDATIIGVGGRDTNFIEAGFSFDKSNAIVRLCGLNIRGPRGYATGFDGNGLSIFVNDCRLEDDSINCSRLTGQNTINISNCDMHDCKTLELGGSLPDLKIFAHDSTIGGGIDISNSGSGFYGCKFHSAVNSTNKPSVFSRCTFEGDINTHPGSEFRYCEMSQKSSLSSSTYINCIGSTSSTGSPFTGPGVFINCYAMSKSAEDDSRVFNHPGAKSANCCVKKSTGDYSIINKGMS